MREKVLILGLSNSGIAAAECAVNKGYDVYITESKSIGDIREEYRSRLEDLESKGIKIETGGHSEKFIEGAKFAVTSPGIPPKSDIFRRLNEKGIKIISEIEFAYINTKTPFIAITGTNGKTTTTSLVSHILSQKFSAPVCGNIGVPPSSLADEKHDFLVCEVSSFQAQMTEKFKAKIACWTNFTPDHIDWHDGLENYFKAKAKLFLPPQEPEFAVLNAKDERLREFAKQCKNVVFFDDEKDCGIKDNAICYKGEEIIRLSDCPLVGHHNYQNIMCGIIIAKLLGMNNADIRDKIMSFKRIYCNN